MILCFYMLDIGVMSCKAIPLATWQQQRNLHLKLEWPVRGLPSDVHLMFSPRDVPLMFLLPNGFVRLRCVLTDDVSCFHLQLASSLSVWNKYASWRTQTRLILVVMLAPATSSTAIAATCPSGLQSTLFPR
jgi:hypothetical protein